MIVRVLPMTLHCNPVNTLHVRYLMDLMMKRRTCTVITALIDGYI
jgi:hypothetical protein